jgi:hypothetical protein
VDDATTNFAVGGMSWINNTDRFVHFMNNKLLKKIKKFKKVK